GGAPVGDEGHAGEASEAAGLSQAAAGAARGAKGGGAGAVAARGRRHPTGIAVCPADAGRAAGAGVGAGRVRATRLPAGAAGHRGVAVEAEGPHEVCWKIWKEVEALVALGVLARVRLRVGPGFHQSVAAALDRGVLTPIDAWLIDPAISP